MKNSIVPLILAAFALGAVFGSFTFGGSVERASADSSSSDVRRYQFGGPSSAFVIDTTTGTVKKLGAVRTGTWAKDYADFSAPPTQIKS